VAILSGFLVRFLVRVSYLEIYNEQVRDLLGKDFLKKLDIKENEGGVYVQGLSSIVVKSEKDMERILAAGKKNRKHSHWKRFVKNKLIEFCFLFPLQKKARLEPQK